MPLMSGDIPQMLGKAGLMLPNISLVLGNIPPMSANISRIGENGARVLEPWPILLRLVNRPAPQRAFTFGQDPWGAGHRPRHATQAVAPPLKAAASTPCDEREHPSALTPHPCRAA